MKKLLQIVILMSIMFVSYTDIYTQLKIMTFGESIARGSSSLDWAGFRRPLHILLTNYGYDFDFVGNEKLGLTDDFDADHECYSYWYVDGDPDTTQNHNLKNYIYGFLKNHHPNMVLLYLGSHDLKHGDNAENLTSEVSAVLDEIDRYEERYSTNVTVVLSTLINCTEVLTSTPLSLEISKFNKQLIEMAETRINDSVKADNITILDMESEAKINYMIDSTYPFTNGDMLSLFFPNDNGYVKMAEVWANKLSSILGIGNPNLINLVEPAEESTITSTSYIFRWDTLSVASSFRLQVARDFYFRDLIFDERNIISDSVQVDGLESGKQYFWRVIAKQEDGKTTYSVIRKFNVLLPILPVVGPENLIAEIISNNNIQLSWADNDNNELGFIIERKVGEEFIILDTLSDNVTSYLDSNLLAGNTYIYKVRSYNEVSSSPYSNEITIKINHATVIGPNNLTAATLSINKVYLSWDDFDDFETGFILERKEGEGNFIVLDTIAANVTSYIDSNLIQGISYYYRVRSFNEGSVSVYSNEVVVSLVTSVENSQVPKEFKLLQNYPNPFNPVTNIDFQLPLASFVELKVYDIIGNEAAVLINEYRSAGSYNVKFDASSLPSGVYFFQIRAGKFSDTKKLIILK